MNGRVALVTGASSGIGRATALAFHREGATVIAADLAPGDLPQAVRQVRCDVASSAEVGALFAAIGRLDFAVNNAGVEGGRGMTSEYDLDEWQRVLSINLTGVFHCLRAELKLMLPERSGAVVNVASIFGARGATSAPAYVASKHGVVGLTRAAALEVANRGIRVNAVCPGYVETPMVMDRGLGAGRDPAKLAEIVDRQPIRRLGRPEEVAEAILWLCSDASSLVNGETLFTDGGLTARA
jgi:NAD(P)-dependent dehydrogenase (short-subunit alcohol dehydrogenase family)